MKERTSILEESVKNILIYAMIFFIIMAIIGVFVVKNNYNDEIAQLEEKYKEQINLSSNKYIQEEIDNIKKYLDDGFSYLENSAKEFIDSNYNFAYNYYHSSNNKDEALDFLIKNTKYPIKYKIYNGIDPEYQYYTKYMELDNGKMLKINIDEQKYKETQRKVALENIKNLHNIHLSNFDAKEIDDDFTFLDNESWYCVYENNIYTCYDKNWWIKIEFSAKTSALEDSLIKAKSDRFLFFIKQSIYISIAMLFGYLLLYLYTLKKRKEVKEQIEIATNHFDDALNTQIANFNKLKSINTDFTYKEFRTLSYALLRFIRKIKAKDSHLKKQAYIDNITGLMNMVSVYESLKLYNKKQGKVLLFCFLNIASFRAYNSMYGRNFGDEILKLVGFRLYSIMKNIPVNDDEHTESNRYKNNDKYLFIQNNETFECLARISADEFLLVTEVNENEDFYKIAKSYQQKLISKNIKINSNDENISYEPFKINARIGYCVYPNDSDNILECIGNADLAIENDKATGDNVVFGYTKEIGEQNEADLKLQQDIRNGIVNKEFLLYYQPKVDCQSGKIIGAEALVRWQKGDKLIFPDQFIGLCEKSNLIITLGNEIIKMACDAQRRWIQQGLKLKLSINLSTKQLLNENIINTIEKNMQGIDPSLLEFEITESFSIENAASKGIIDKIKKLNVGLSMDDFGKGYSSLSYLNNKDLDFDVVKIDKCFIQNIDKNERNKKLVAFIVKMIKSLNKRSVAEGVENEEILTFLQSLGCDEYQGYYFSKPVPEKILLERVYNNAKN
ncbi:putative bifunctional diguanylate cyclase/phosphodiesterase [Campylobacter sp. MG1]|uniref:putative bifunctional diguanylate cyclase/phosphodiesterase n=1 Tax=Campylobacter sp. MG1 TaxID=2976332 RepID=UPI00226D11FB|nr:bifunctional diguanylate cyclase/phosphodiesterase [Campylobacter sp. MG1]